MVDDDTILEPQHSLSTKSVKMSIILWNWFSTSSTSATSPTKFLKITRLNKCSTKQKSLNNKHKHKILKKQNING